METRINQEIRLFKHIESIESGHGIVAADDDPDLEVLRRWHKSGVFTGRTGRDVDGVVFFSPALSEYGISLFEKRLRELEESGSLGFIKKYRFKFYAWVFIAIIAPVVVWWIIEELKKNA